MPWDELTPIAKISPRCKALINIIKGDVAQLKISFAAHFTEELKHPKRADVLAGSGEHTGQLLVKLNDKDGKFEFREFAKGGVGLVMPLPNGIVKKEREAEPCVTEVSAAGIVVKLPVDIWAAIDARVDAENKRQAASPPRPAAAPARQVETLDVVRYLGLKNIKVERLKDDCFRVAGERMTRNELFTIINRHRRAGDLPDLARVTDFF